jgi:hypothetical protein
MRISISIIALAAVLAVLPAGAWAQWPDYPTSGVPRLPDGKPNLEAPAPRTADGHPDLSGIWEFVSFRLQSLSAFDAAPPAGPPTTGAKAAPPASDKAPPAASTFSGPVGQFFNIGSTIGGLPFTPWAAELRKQRTADNNKDNPDAHCLPLGLMQLHTHVQPRKIIQTPKLIVILFEAQAGVRQIFMDGRPLPRNDVQPWWYAYSVGHWDGDTLVVESSGFRDDVWLDVEGSPLTSSGKMTERFRRVNYGTLEIEVTVEDPKAYTKPWTVKITQHVLLDTDLIEFICSENEKSDEHLVGRDK